MGRSGYKSMINMKLYHVLLAAMTLLPLASCHNHDEEALLQAVQHTATAQRITYLKESKWSQDTLLLGGNGLAALTFCDVPLETGKTP